MAEIFPKRLAIVSRQVDQLRVHRQALLPANKVYSDKFNSAEAPRRITTLQQLASSIPFTTKAEIVQDQRSSPLFGTNLTYPLERYIRYHQTSGTSGAPLRWLDTAESWQWMLGNWEQILRVAGVRAGDSVFFAFSFGPFIGFWLAFEAAARLGCLCLPRGGFSTTARLSQVLELRSPVPCCTPNYAIHLAETAAVEKIHLSRSAVKHVIVAGGQGVRIPATR